jgi:hypothetical protein
MALRHLFLFRFACDLFCLERMSVFGFKWQAKESLCVRGNFSTANALKLRSVYNLLLLFKTKMSNSSLQRSVSHMVPHAELQISV